MHPYKILVPYDFSPRSIAALEAAVLLARGSNGTVVAAHVAPSHTLSSGFEELIPSSDLDGPSKQLAEVCRDVTCAAVEHRILHGPIAEAIVEFAVSEQVDLIVLGAHGRRGLNKLVMGSVAEAVLRASPKPVLLVRGSAVESDAGDVQVDTTEEMARIR